MRLAVGRAGAVMEAEDWEGMGACWVAAAPVVVVEVTCICKHGHIEDVCVRLESHSPLQVDIRL